MALGVFAIAATGASQVARPPKARNNLLIANQSATATVYVAFDAAAVAAATAGQLTLQPAAATNVSSVQFVGDAPGGAINIIASAAAPVTVVE